jgi:predicted nucleotidyltransferase
VEPPDLSEVFAAHGVAVAYLFGSRTEGTARADRDHDIAVLFTAAPPLDATAALAADLAARLGTPVDV